MAAAALMWWIDGALPIARLIYAPWSRLGWAFVVLGVGIDAYAAASFFKAKTTVNPLRVASAMHLVTSGIYRWSRNPMYCGLIIALAGWDSSSVPWLLFWRSLSSHGFWSWFRSVPRNRRSKPGLEMITEPISGV